MSLVPENGALVNKSIVFVEAAQLNEVIRPLTSEQVKFHNTNGRACYWLTTGFLWDPVFFMPFGQTRELPDLAIQS